MMVAEQTELFEKSNDKEIIKAVKRFFRRYYSRLVLKSGRSLNSLKSPKYDGMPKAPGTSTDRDGQLAEDADCQVIVDCVLEAFQIMTSVSTLVVWRSMVDNDLDVGIAKTLNLRHSQFGRRKKAALIEFYYAFEGRLERRGIHVENLNFESYLRH